MQSNSIVADKNDIKVANNPNNSNVLAMKAFKSKLSPEQARANELARLRTEIVEKIGEAPGNFEIVGKGPSSRRVPKDEQVIPKQLLSKFVEAFLSADLAYNSLIRKIEYKGEVILLDDLKAFVERLPTQFDYYISNDRDLISYVKYFAFKNTYSPVKNYLENLKVSNLEDIDITNLATRYLGNTSELANLQLYKTLIAAVARVYQPGCKVDTILFLTGKQGCGKSTFFRVLSNGWFDDTVQNLTNKDEILKLHASLIIELAEAEKMLKLETATYKAQITTPVDKLRKPYGKDNADYPRPSIMVGTSNNNEIFLDTTGNRRGWVIPVKVSKIDTDFLSTELDRIWAKAVAEYEKKTIWWLSEIEDALNDLNNKSHQITNPVHQAIDNFFSNHPELECASQAEIGKFVFDDKHITHRNIKMDIDTYLQKLAKERTRNGTKYLAHIAPIGYQVSERAWRYFNPYFKPLTSEELLKIRDEAVNDYLA